MKFRSLMVLVLALFAVPAFAQEKKAVTYPGSVWSANGTLSPAEKGNITSLSHAEQGIMYKGYAELFTLTTVGADSKGYDWNNKVQLGAGVRFTQSIKPGMVRVSVAYVNENRFKSDTNVSGIVVSADTYLSWGRR